jgi:hypothetical protein
MKKSILFIILFLSGMLFYFNCNGDLLEEGPDGGTTTFLDVKLRGIWMVGGLSGSNHTTAVSAVDLYDPVTNTWYPSVTTLPTPVSFAGAVSIKISATDHRIYVFGGFDNAGIVKNTVQYYTIETDSWSTGSNITGPRANICAARLNNKIYIMGGSNTDASVAYSSNTTTYEYYPAGNSWNTMTVFGATASERFMLVSESVIYNFGGRNAFATLIPVAANHLGLNLYQSTLGTETSATETALSSPRTGIAGDIYDALGGDVMIIAGGFTAIGKSATATSVLTNTTSSTPTNIVEYLAFPFTGPASWTTATATGATFPSLGFGSAVVYYSASLTPNYRFYYFGGTANLTSAASGSTGAGWCDLPQPPNAWAYTWTSITSMQTGRYGFTAVKIQQ